MYPEPDFYFLYRSLIESYRIVPEAAAAQLDEMNDGSGYAFFVFFRGKGGGRIGQRHVSE